MFVEKSNNTLNLKTVISFIVLVILNTANVFAVDERFPFVVPGFDSSKSATDMSYLSPGPSSDFGFVRIKDGHFYTDDGRLRIWGANICIDGNFPDKKDAAKIAAHLRKLGINGIRFHHADWYPSPRGIWAKELVNGKRVFDPKQQDKLEYFMAELRKKGIYFDLNLHVTRTFLEEEGFVTEGLPPIAATNNKWILYFEPNMRKLLKEYCRMYLTHVNPYTKLKLVDDPAVAVVEITNENIFSRDPSYAYQLPEPYSSEFQRQWNVWLKKKYRSTDGLKKVYLADIKLQQGAVPVALPQGQSIEKGNIELPAKSCNPLAKKDLKQFMIDTETEFVIDMKNFLVNELGVKVPITASQFDYHDESVIPKTCDYADIHIYWQHPEFPNISWDKEDWFLPTKPMEWFPLTNSLLNTGAAKRIEGMPYTMSEWNIPNPSLYSASLATFAAMVAATQDWDAVYFFEYHSLPGQWDVDHITEFFELNGNPVKVAMTASCANMFRRADLKPLKKKALGTLRNIMPGAMALSRQIGIDPKAKKPDEKIYTKEKFLKSDDGSLVWDARDKEKAYVKASGDASRAVWGFIANQSFDLAGIKICVDKVERNYGAIVFTSLDGEKLEDSKRILLTAAGAADNLNMGWNEAHNSVGIKWGQGPSHITTVSATIAINSDIKKIYALDGKGKRKKNIPIINIDGKTTFKTSAKFKTLWYEIVAD